MSQPGQIAPHETQATVLVIDDELGPRESLRFLLKNDYRVLCADTVDSGLTLLRENSPDAVILDIRMPGRNGIDGLREIRKHNPNLSVIMLTGYAAVSTAQEALRNDASDYIEKPFDALEMRRVVQRHVEQTRLRRKRDSLLGEAEVLHRRVQEMQDNDRMAELGHFSAEFVHDLRNSLAAVSGSLDLLRLEVADSQRQSAPPSEAERYLDMLEQAMQQCVGLLNTWQRLIRQDPDHQALILVHEFASSCVEHCQPLAAAARARLVFEPLGQDAHVLGDRVQLTRAVTNLIHNAIHALPKANGLVSVRVEQRGASICLGVADNGCGIPPENMERLFTPNFTTKRARGGMGLGLFIVRKVAENHGGALTFESVVNRGSTFTLSLPVCNPV